MVFDREFPEFLLEVDKVRPLPYQKIKSSALLKTYIDGLQFYFENPELVSDELLKLKLKELILLLAKTDNAATIKTLVASLFSKTVVDFKSVIEANIFVDIGVNELAVLTNQSLSTFKRSFFKHYQTTPANYIRKRRLEHSAKMLLTKSLRVADVAYKCGFKDQGHFSKLLTKEFLVSPKMYRLNGIDQPMN
ncbi:MAG: helix-turn-helix transcriptional regulator [Saprospiraceae bacterium]|nr:helix-turn-helix transcriptional regulator [Saprospiraceae bacterium]